MLVLQLGPKKILPLELIQEKWRALALPQEKFDDLVRIGSFGGETEWLKIFALAASTLNDVSCIPSLQNSQWKQCDMAQ